MQRNSVELSEVYIALLGSTGEGKSASGNTILGGDRKTFKEGYSAESVTRICSLGHTEVDGRTINVIDTVGLSDTDEEKNNDLQCKIEQIFECTRHGVDVLLLVIRLGVKLTNETFTAVKWVQENFGEKVLKYTIVLFTHGDQFHETIEDYLGERHALRSVVDQCSGGFHVFDNKDKDPSQVTELLEKINKLRRKNVQKRYTEQDYEKTQEIILLKRCMTGAAPGGERARGGVLGAVGKVAAAGAVVCAGLYFFLRKK